MNKTFKKALDYIRENIDEYELYHKMTEARMTGCSFSNLYPQDADDIIDVLEEYGAENDLPEGWWMEHGVIDEIVELI